MPTAIPNLMPFQMEPFNGDTHLEELMLELRDKHKIEIAIELGTCLGSSTMFFAKNFTEVITTEINQEFADIAAERIEGFDNVTLYVADSRSVLSHILPATFPALLFIDSHWGPSNPLIQELEIIAKHGNPNLVLVIHDFKVPDRDFQFDTYPEQGIVYEWDWIKDKIPAIYPQGFTYRYNREATGAKVGVIVIEPK